MTIHRVFSVYLHRCNMAAMDEIEQMLILRSVHARIL